jgi:integrase
MGVFKRNENWWIDYYDSDGQRKREKVGPVFNTAKDVLRMRLDQAAREKRFGKTVTIPSVTFEATAAKYLEWSRANKKSWWRDEQSFKMMRGFLAGKKLSDISPFLIEKYKMERRGKVGPRTVNIELAFMRHLFTKAIEWGLALENPVRKVKLFRENNQRVRFLSHGEAQRLLEACPAHLKPIIIVALYTGMRRSEILSLSWDDIDFRNGIISIRDSKNGEGRKVLMNETVVAALSGMDRKWKDAKVFLRADGNPVVSIRTAFENAVKRAGINDFHFHDCRHCFGSWLVMSGVDLRTVQELMGHRTFAMTLRYSHLSSEHKKDAVRVLDRMCSHYLDTGVCARKNQVL